ncbi:MAG TPA: AEC family transporter [Geminicoccaceae bacterium]|nr:AEC family transporter [Geminicoccus sp.]HMU51833.1 AEC family transporter [Geminicoccaceae bacterium]
MATILGVAIPFFAVLLCGMLASRLRLLDTKGLMGLNSFVFWFALPALLFHKVATTPFGRLADPWLYLAYEGSCVILYGLVYLAARLARLSPAMAAICAFAAAWGNVGYMGVPLLIAAYGEARALPAVLAVVMDNLVLQSLTILILEASLGADKGGLRTVIRAVCRNPLIIAVFAGAVVAYLGLRLPLPVTGFLGLIGAAAAPAALFALGATLYGGSLTGHVALVANITAAKLVALPLIAFGMVSLLPLPADLVVPIIVTTGLPTASSVFVIAQRYGILEAPVAAVVFVSHLLGIVTLTVLLVLLGG